jgi:hypothetical protein
VGLDKRAMPLLILALLKPVLRGVLKSIVVDASSQDNYGGVAEWRLGGGAFGHRRLWPSSRSTYG